MSAKTRGAPPVPWPRVWAALCLLAPFLALLWVPLYARATPSLAGVPFFYWYQLGWVLLTPALMFIAYRLRRRRGRPLDDTDDADQESSG